LKGDNHDCPHLARLDNPDHADTYEALLKEEIFIGIQNNVFWASKTFNSFAVKCKTRLNSLPS
jgi:hypothetical protein